jgi:hypothetical protein
MKNLEMNKSAKRILVSVVLATVLFFTAHNTVKANINNPIVLVESENGSIAGNVSVNYVGTQNDNLMFHVNFNNTTTNPAILTITNEAGETLYSVKIKDKEFNKTFAISQEFGAEKISFTVKTNVDTEDGGSLITAKVKTFNVSDISNK